MKALQSMKFSIFISTNRRIKMKPFCLKEIYSRLGDEKSRFLFEKRLCYSLTGDMQRALYAVDEANATYKKLRETNKEIFKFGAGAKAYDEIKKYPKIPWKAFIENDKSKVGKSDILPVISFEEFIANSKNAVVFISSHLHGDEMKQQLLNNGFSEEFIIDSRVRNEYFDLPQFKPCKNEFFIDAGGFDGKTTKDFFHWTQNNGGEKGRSLIFEPNHIQYNVCRDNLQNCDNVKILNNGLWHKKETLKFHKASLGSHITSDGEEIIEAIGLDEYLKDEKEPVTFIKMDIEGAELNALKGAERIIREQKPKLAISIYHKPEDIWEIPSLVLDFVPDYKFYLKHYYYLSFSDTVLFALPK
jgi:FkbM family methyltransferase